MKNDEIDLDSMHSALIQRHNAIVGEDDLTYLLGDFAFCKPDQAMRFMMSMNGKKYIILL